MSYGNRRPRAGRRVASGSWPARGRSDECPGRLCRYRAQSGPRAAKDRDAFEWLFRDTVNLDLELEFRGTAWPVETILYKWLRCELVHEGGLPVDVDFVDDGDGALPMIGGDPAHGVLRLGNGWYELLLRTVVTHPVNADLFTWRQDLLESARASA